MSLFCAPMLETRVASRKLPAASKWPQASATRLPARQMMAFSSRPGSRASARLVASETSCFQKAGRLYPLSSKRREASSQEESPWASSRKSGAGTGCSAFPEMLSMYCWSRARGLGEPADSSAAGRLASTGCRLGLSCCVVTSSSLGPQLVRGTDGPSSVSTLVRCW